VSSAEGVAQQVLTFVPSRVEADIQLYSITVFFLTHHLHNIERRAGRTGRQVLNNGLYDQNSGRVREKTISKNREKCIAH